MARRVVRLVDVATEAGVGTSVVSRVLNDDPTLSIRDETRQRIVDTARRLEYRPNGFARGLKLARTMTIGLVINLGYSENANLIAAVERAAARLGYMTLLADASEFTSRGGNYGRLLMERRVDGLLMASGLGEDAFIRELRDYRLPIVVVNRRVRGVVPSVSLDDALGMRVAVEHLIQLGHTSIAYIGGPPGNDVSKRRRAGYKAAIRGANLRVSAGLVTESSEHEEGGFEAGKRLLQGRRPPTAIAVWSATVAVGALAAIRRSGHQVPRDISIISLHDAKIGDYLEPPLATVRMPVAKLASVAVESVIKLVEGQDVEDTIVTEPSPVVVRRGSTAAPPPD
jgi:LacI family transcriptional regulator